MLQLAVNKLDGISKDSNAPWHYLTTSDIRERVHPVGNNKLQPWRKHLT